MHEHCMAFPSITGDKKGVNAQRKNTCTQMRIKTSLEAHEPETKLEATNFLKSTRMEDEQFQARLQRLDRDILYFQHILEEAPQRERREIRRQLLAALREKKTLLERQKELSRTKIEQKNLENERMARVLEVLERRRNEQN